MGRFAALCTAAMLFANPGLSAAQSPRVPNATPYRVKTPVTTGPAGNATVFTRALIAKDGVSTIDVATAPFGTPSATPITSVQVRGLTPSGAVAFVRNFSDTRLGEVMWPLTDLVAGQALQIDVHVLDDRVPRTDVAMLQDIVRLRPDLRVTALRTPQRIVAGVPATIAAVIDEHNGDTGARATCELIVDGALVDDIQNMWVDAGDTVSCAFTHAFAEGTHAIRVLVTNVDPSDWDDSNNVLASSVDVVPPFQIFDSYYVSAGESTETRSEYHKASYVFGGSPATGDDYLSQADFRTWTQGVDVQAYASHRWAFPISSIDLTAADDAGPRVSAHMTDIAATSSSTYAGYQTECGSRTDGSNTRSVTVFVCSVHSSLGDSSSLLLLQGDGAVTYTSLEYGRTWSGDPDNVVGYYYYWNVNDTQGEGDLIPFGSTVAVSATVTTATSYDGVETVVPINEPVTLRFDNPLMCGVDTYSWGSVNWCSESHYVKVSRIGVATGGSTLP